MNMIMTGSLRNLLLQGGCVVQSAMHWKIRIVNETAARVTR